MLANSWPYRDNCRSGEHVHSGLRREAFRNTDYSLARTFIGIAVHTATANDDAGRHSADLAAGVRQDANGLLGTTVQLSDLVSRAGVSRTKLIAPR